MKDLFLYEKGIFLPALFVSASLHVALIGASGWLPSVPYASVLQAPSSLEVTVVSQPVVTVMEDQIVSEEILDGAALEEVVFSDRRQEAAREESAPSAAPSRESRGAVTKAQPLAQVNPAPSYPRIARQRGWEGIVRLEVLVDKDGVPASVGIRESSGHDVLDRSAAETVAKWRFSPARSGPVQFSSRITIPVQFSLIRE